MWGELFSVSFWDFSCFLDELVLPGSCSILELRFLNCVLFTAFWRLDLALAWYLQYLRVWISHSDGIATSWSMAAWISHAHGICNMLVCGWLGLV